MKKISIVAVVIIGCIQCSLFITGCAQKERGIVFAVGGAPTEIDFWEDIVATFEEESGIAVDLLRQPTDTDQRRQNLVTALRASQSTPDLFLMDVAWIAQFAASEWLEPLSPFLASSTLSASDFFKPVIHSAATYNGKLIALPVYVDGGLLYYRKDLLERYGFKAPPTTWDELVKIAHTVIDGEKKQGDTLTGFVWQGSQYEGLVCTFLEFAGSNGGGIALNDSLPIIATEPNRSALTFMHDVIHSEKISPVNTYTDMKEEEVRLAFQNGGALFERNWPYAYKLHNADDSPVKGKVGITVLPHFSGGASMATLGGWHIGISQFSRQKEQAFALLVYLLSFEVQKATVLKLGWNPGRADVYHDSAVVSQLPHLQTLHDVFEHAVSRPNVPYYSYLSSVLQRYLNAAIAGSIPVTEAIDRCESELKVVVNRYTSTETK